MSTLNKFRETTVWPPLLQFYSNNTVDESQKKCVNQLDKFYQQLSDIWFQMMTGRSVSITHSGPAQHPLLDHG